MGRVAAIQMNSTDSVDENLRTLEKLIPEAASRGAELVVLPENVAFMGVPEDGKILMIVEAPGQGPIQKFLSKLAKQLDIWIIGGTLPISAGVVADVGAGVRVGTRDSKLVYAACFVWNNLGENVARYDKIHLFDVKVQPKQEEYFESKTICPGKDITCINSPLGKLGLSVCYDLRFPELYRKLFNMGAEILTVPSAFTAVTGKAHWEILLRARAIENFSYVIAANQQGLHRNKRSTWGHTMIIDPWGTILDVLPEGEGVVVADIDLDYLHDLRSRFPVAEHRRIF